MPGVVGMSLDEAEKILAEHDLTVKLSYAESEDYAKDTVIGQNPAKDTVVAKAQRSHPDGQRGHR